REIAVRGFGNGSAAEQAAAAAFGRFETRLQAEYASAPLVLFTGVEDALAALRRLGLKLATNSGFPRAWSELIVARRRPLQGLDAHVAGDEVPAGRPAPYMVQLAMQRTGVERAARVLVAGDTPLDLRAGTAAGAGGVVAVLTGSHGV